MADTALLAPLKKFATPTSPPRASAARASRLPACARYGSTPAASAISPAAIAISNSSPENDRLAYITRAEAAAYLDEIEHGQWPVREIGFTGGEPFMNPDIIDMLGDALERGFQVLLLTNAMQPMLRPHIREGLMRLNKTHGGRLAPSRQPRSLYAESCTTPSGPPGPSPRPSKGSTGSRVKALRWRWPAAPAGARASRPRATAMPR